MCCPYSVLHPVGFTVPALSPGPRCALAAPFRPYPSEAGRIPFCGTIPDPRLRGGRRALPGTVVPWSPDFPRRSKLHRGRPALWLARYRGMALRLRVRPLMSALGGKQTLPLGKLLVTSCSDRQQRSRDHRLAWSRNWVPRENSRVLDVPKAERVLHARQHGQAEKLR